MSKVVLQTQQLLPALVFFVVFYLCLWKWIDLKLIYHGGGLMNDFPSFYWGWEFARDFQTRPGGLVDYGSALLAQALCVSWFGALVLTAQAALLYTSAAGCLRALGGRDFRLAAFILPLVLLAIYCKYRHYSAPVASLTVGSTCLWGWFRFVGARTWRGFLAGFLLLGCLYAAAPSALLVFLPSVILFELRARSSWLGLLLFVVVSALAPAVLGAALFGFAPGEAYAKLLPLVWDPTAWKVTGASLVAGLYLLWLLLCLVAAMLSLLTRQKEKQGQPPSESRRGAPRAGFWKLQAPGLALLAVALVYLTLNTRLKAALEVDYLVWHGRWNEVLVAAQANPRNPFVACAVAQARYHTGRLTGELPTLPSPQDLLLSSEQDQSHWKKSDLYFDLGYVNMALHHLTEAVEFYGERPLLLQRLALVNLALGNVSTAKVYLGTLARAPFQGAWARRYLDQLNSDPVLAGDAEVGRLRSLMVKRDSVVALSPDQELLMLLNANRQNRMAFEYVMTYYLLTKNLDAFVQNVSRVRDFPGFTITPLWDEALVLASRLAGRRVDVPGHQISSEANRRVDAVAQRAKQYGDNAELARRELFADYGHTYIFYWFFHL